MEYAIPSRVFKVNDHVKYEFYTVVFPRIYYFACSLRQLGFNIDAKVIDKRINKILRKHAEELDEEKRFLIDKIRHYLVTEMKYYLAPW